VTPDPVSTLPRLPGATPGGDHRERLLAAMAQAVIEHGFRETTVAQVAEAADVAESTFFLHFPSKDAVLTEYARQALDEVTETLRAHAGSAVDALRAASPFPPMPDDVRCLSLVPIVGTFSNPVSS
jgi:AcrR family transcriptional regulator